LKFVRGGVETPLDTITQALEVQNNLLGKNRAEYLAKEVELEHLENKWADELEGESQAARERKVKASERWLKLASEVARLKAIFEFQKLRYEILDKEWLAQYASMKLDERTIRKQGGNT
jgi:hypothetical protein